MKKNRNLAVAVFCGALVIFGMQSQTAAQENKWQGPPSRGEGSWDLVRIETTSIPFGHGANPRLFPRETKELPVGTRERKVDWGHGDLKIYADVLFQKLKETVTIIDHGSQVDFDPDLFVKAEVKGRIPTGFVVFKYVTDIQTSSGYDAGKDVSRWDKRIYSSPEELISKSADRFVRKGEWAWHLLPFGGHPKAEEDFTFNVRVLVFAGSVTLDYPAHGIDFSNPWHVDVTYHFHYKWAGWRDAGNPATSGSTSSPGDTGVGPLDREGQYRWAQKQDASALESRLISNAARLFNSPSVPSEKLSSAFADISVIVADRAARANFSADDKDAASSIWSTHKNWAARQGPKVSLDNLQQRLSAAFKYLSRSQKDLFYADVSVAIAKAEVAAPTNQAAAEEGPFVKSKKDVFGVGENITVEFGYLKSTGWDWVVIAQPGKEKSAAGSHTGIDDDRSYKLEPGDNSIKDRRGTITFRGLPEGKYVAKYVSWANGHAVLTSTEITVGKASSPPPASGGQPPVTSTSRDLTGLWVNPSAINRSLGGRALYRLRQVGNKVVWGMDAVSLGSYANVFQGQINGDMIDGIWEDLPGSPTIGGGRMLLKVESDCKFVRVSSVNPYAADIWVRKDSTCDVVGLTQRSNPSGTKPASTATKPATGATDKEAANAKPKPGSPAKTKPKIEEIADNRGRTNPATAPTNKTNKPAPVVEEIPETTPTKTAANKPAPKSANKPPVVEEIPETAVTNTASNKPRTKPPVVEEIPEQSNRPASTSKSTSKQPNPSGGSDNQPKEKPKKEKKPKDPNKPDIWTRLGEAAREAITGQQNPGQTQPSAQAQPQRAGCQVGPYSLWALNQPRANEQVFMRFTAPAGRGTGSGDWVGVFRAGETQSTNDRLVTWMYLTSPDCVERFNLPAGQFDAYVFDASSFRATGNRSPISSGVRLIVSP